jgi:hypothetical protein
MILFGATLYFAMATLFVMSLALAAARPVPTPDVAND